MYPHEYAHSFMAWLLGYKSNPLAITYGGTSWQNLLGLIHIDENVNYPMIFHKDMEFKRHSLHLQVLELRMAHFSSCHLAITNTVFKLN